MNTKLTGDDEQRILALAGAGKTNRQIADELGGKVSHTSISRFLARSRETRADAAKAIVREQLVTGLPVDLDRIEREASRLASIADVLGEKVQGGTARGTDAGRYFKSIDRLAKLTDLKLHYAGADTPDKDPVDDGAVDRVLAKLQAMLDEPPEQPTIQ